MTKLSLESIIALTRLVTHHGNLGTAVLKHLGVFNKVENAQQLLDKCYEGEYKSQEDFAHQLFNNCYNIPAHLEPYINYQGITQYLFRHDYFSLTIDDKVHVFHHI